VENPITYISETTVDDEGEVRLPGWYFYDETWTYLNGPYETETLANQELDRYVKEFLNG
jgi:hypothetical protein